MVMYCTVLYWECVGLWFSCDYIYVCEEPNKSPAAALFRLFALDMSWIQL
jgi:hypothetical protein